MYLKTKTEESMNGSLNKLKRLKSELESAEAVIIGAGAGLSTSAGFTYSGARFDKYFSDFERKYGFKDMYSGGFYPYTTYEEHWAFWSRYIYINRYMDPPKSVYNDLFKLVKDKDYFVITTNVDHCFQKAGFDKNRLFYTQGDYGLFQCSVPCQKETFDNEEMIKQMLLAQGYDFDSKGNLSVPAGKELKMKIPSELVPVCPNCGKPFTMNLRSDDTFAEDSGWHNAAGRYSKFLKDHENMHILFLELGVGYNTPVIIKIPFMQVTYKNKNAVYACINYGEAVAPSEIKERSICINEDIGEVLDMLL